MLPYILLGLLSRGESLTGYEMKGAIERGVGVFYRASFGSLYPALKKLENDGQVFMTEDGQGGRKKKRYAITDPGLESFRSWLISPMAIGENSNVHLAKVYFFDQLPEEDRRQQITAYEVNNLQYLHKLQELERDFARQDHMEEHYYKLSTLYYGIAVIRQTIRWCRHIREGKPLEELLSDGLPL